MAEASANKLYLGGVVTPTQYFLEDVKSKSIRSVIVIGLTCCWAGVFVAEQPLPATNSYSTKLIPYEDVDQVFI
jgi:hypothetical protein